MQNTIETFFAKVLPPQIEKLALIRSRVEANAAASLHDAVYIELDSTLQGLVAECAKLDADLSHSPTLLQETRTRFQEQVTPYLIDGWLSSRMIEKPRGYAGDYRTLIGVYDKGPLGTGYGAYLDLWVTHLTLARSIRSRWQEMRKFLEAELSSRGGEVSILDIASGPCREFSTPLSLDSDCTVRLQCLDNDPESLDFVRKNIAARSGIADFRLAQYNALRLKNPSSTIKAFGKFDIVYSIGLFDYIDDVRLVQILAGIRELVNENGVVYLNFKDAVEYNKIEYQWLLDWHFYQRTESDCLELFAQAGYDMAFMSPTTRDETNVIINFINRPSTATRRRVDAPTSIPAPHRIDIETSSDEAVG